MAVSRKYGRLSIPNVGDDEPVFVLRAHDKLAEFAMEMYGVLAISHALLWWKIWKSRLIFFGIGLVRGRSRIKM